MGDPPIVSSLSEARQAAGLVASDDKCVSIPQACSTAALPIAWAVMERIKVEIEKDWLSVGDICEYMSVSAFVVTSQLRAGGLPGVKFGREWRVARQDFEDWINEQRKRSTE